MTWFVQPARAVQPGDWLACEYPERPPDDHIGLCARPCRACLVVAEVLLNQVDPFNERATAMWHHAIAILAGEVPA